MNNNTTNGYSQRLFWVVGMLSSPASAHLLTTSGAKTNKQFTAESDQTGTLGGVLYKKLIIITCSIIWFLQIIRYSFSNPYFLAMLCA